MRSGLKNPATTQIAFFGGSFTAIDQSDMIALLQEADALVREFGLGGIRISTRPDRVEDEVLQILRHYGVTAIELGAQSMDDEVLGANLRGHTVRDVREAAGRIHRYGFELGLQMMTGLYRDTAQKAVDTVDRLIALHPATMRIYPTVLLPHTHLEELYRQGRYRPQELDEAVNLCAGLIRRCERAGVRVIRVGLHAEAGVEREHIAGPYHPAFRELCESRMFLEELLPALRRELEKNGENRV